jgi:hypothetical protein
MLTLPSFRFFSFATSYAQIEISTSLQEAVHKAIENSSIKNKELKLKTSASGKSVGTNTYQLLSKCTLLLF